MQVRESMINRTTLKTIHKLSTHLIFEQYNCILYVLLIILVSILNIKHLHNISDNRLAFSISIIYTSRINHNYKTIRSIRLKNINYSIIKSIIYQSANLFYVPKIQYKQLINTIHNLKISGFVNNVKYYIVNNNKIQYNICNICINPIVRMIVVDKFKRLKIPKRILNQYLHTHLGLPKNYQKLNSTIIKIHDWYKNRGFNHISIDIIYNKSPNCIYIKIHEGIIAHISLNCESRLSLDREHLNQIENRIIKELSLSPGSAINTKKIDLGIGKLKKVNLISRCSYHVIKWKKRVKIIILYDLNHDQLKYIHKHYIELRTTNLTYYPNSASKQNNYQILSIYYKKIQKFISTLVFNYLDNILPIDLLSYIRLNNNNQKIEKKLSFRYSQSRKDSKQMKSLNYRLQLLKNVPIFNTTILLPNIKISSNILVFILLCLSDNIAPINILYPVKDSELLNKYYKLNKYNFYHLLKSKSISTKSEHKLFAYTDLSEAINLIYQSISKNIIYIQRNYVLIKKNVCYQILTKQRKTKIQQKCLELDLCIKNYDFYFTHSIKQSKSLTLQIQSIIYLTLNKISVSYLKHYFRQYINIKYYKVIILPNFIITRYKSTVIISLEINNPLHWIDQMSMNTNKLVGFYQNDHKRYCLRLPYSYNAVSYLYNIEYHSFPQTYCSLYLFYNFISKMMIRSKINLHSSLLYRLNNHEREIGSGIELYIPIKNLPPLRIEYCIDNQITNLFLLRFYSKYQT